MTERERGEEIASPWERSRRRALEMGRPKTKSGQRFGILQTGLNAIGECEPYLSPREMETLRTNLLGSYFAGVIGDIVDHWTDPEMPRQKTK